MSPGPREWRFVRAGACSECSTWNNVKIYSNVEICSKRVTGTRISTYEIGRIDNSSQQPRPQKMPLQPLGLAARPVENVSKSWFMTRDSCLVKGAVRMIGDSRKRHRIETGDSAARVTPRITIHDLTPRRQSRCDNPSRRRAIRRNAMTSAIFHWRPWRGPEFRACLAPDSPTRNARMPRSATAWDC